MSWGKIFVLWFIFPWLVILGGSLLGREYVSDEVRKLGAALLDLWWMLPFIALLFCGLHEIWTL